MKRSKLTAILCLLLILAGCTTTAPVATEMPTSSPALSVAEPIIEELPTEQPAQAVQPDGISFRGEPGHIGVYDTRGVPELTGVKWQFQTGGPVWSSPVIANGVVYIGSDDHFFYALDEDTGAEKWKFEAGDDIRCGAAVAEGIVYFTSFDGYVYAVDAASGSEIWKVDLSDGKFITRQQYDDYNASPYVAGGLVYVGGLNPKENFYALDAKTGEIQWSFKPIVDDAIHSTPIVQGNTVFFSGVVFLYAVDAITGAEQWKFAANGNLNYGPALSDGVLYIGSKDTNLYAIDAQNGNELWKVNLSGDSWVTSCPVVKDGVVFAGTSDGRTMHALNAADGALLWEYRTGGYVWSSPAYAEGFIYFGSTDKSLYALKADSGELAWKFETGSGITSSPIVDAGVVFVGSRDGFVYAIH